MKCLRIVALGIATLFCVSTLALAQYGDQRDRGYYSGYNQNSNNSDAYRAGLRQGRMDAENNREWNSRTSRWTSYEDRRAFEIGYDHGYNDAMANNRGTYYYGSRNDNGYRGDNAPNRGYTNERNNGNNNNGYNANNSYNNGRNSNNNNGRGSLNIDRNNKVVTWQAPTQNAQLFMQADNKPEQLFASGRSGSQVAPWLTPGHVFNFMLRDMNGNELSRTTVDTR